ncbi:MULTISPECIES: MptD family putative ECF transporter S component [Schaalia]|uniref:MptD family putative ECF transporter S component n=1 Tax=Schaalia TaxID=2529408 RepID=UPI0023F81E77|nr:MptD family putative ECF transporter S component [Schaalia hyovaginalis]MCI7670838.1 MptD family putative ECF transporter S component [Schaalia hyovaginalis]MDY5506627.1 MptD family putative ECF transporter S component [Schaalia hyovaginalis]
MNTNPTESPVPRFDARTLINIGVFTALYFVIMFATGMVGLLAPGAQIVGFLTGTFINGAIVMLFMVKTRSFGSMTLLGLIVGLLMILTGHYWATVIITPALGLAADALARAGQHRNRWMNILGFALFQQWIIAPLMPILFTADSYFANISAQMGESYAHDMRALFSPVAIAGLLAANFVVALIAGWIGTKILDKHFTRAGIL